ncbi:MAG: hypothetical protein P1U86_22905 [Verrucomicrobiales bacterium]|nr:hypothetical protein [Verrucomicrobiales bacterium]
MKKSLIFGLMAASISACGFLALVHIYQQAELDIFRSATEGQSSSRLRSIIGEPVDVVSVDDFSKVSPDHLDISFSKDVGYVWVYTARTGRTFYVGLDGKQEDVLQLFSIRG